MEDKKIKVLEIEAFKQKELYNSIVQEGWTLAEDPAGLEQYVGQVVDVEVICQEFTPNLLAKLYIKGTEHLEHTFMLVPVWQIVKYNKIIPKEGEVFEGTFVVGVRRIMTDQSYVFTLRLPRG